MRTDVAIIDYGIGNLFSVRRAFEHVGASVIVTADRAELMAAPRVVLPGVGAFADGMQGLKARGLDQVVLELAAAHRPLLGICLGMQMFASVSEEFGEHQGLGLIPGRVQSIPDTSSAGIKHKIPHIGWAGLTLPELCESWDGSILQGLSPGDDVYLVHSYSVHPDDPRHRLADCDYNGRVVSAAIRRDNITGVQFHPEKSGPVGLKIIRNFVDLE